MGTKGEGKGWREEDNNFKMWFIKLGFLPYTIDTEVR